MARFTRKSPLPLLTPETNPTTFRHEVIQAFEAEFGETIYGIIGRIQKESFAFEAMQEVHCLQVRPALLLRHSMPYLATWALLSGCDEPPNEGILQSILMAHTLTLTHLDYHLDGASPDHGNPATAVKTSPESAVSYAVRMAFRSANVLSRAKGGARILQEVIDPVSGFVVERMHEDWLSRYQIPTTDLESSISTYLKSPGSRLMGSGYWEAMIRGAAIACHPDLPVPEFLVLFAQCLRRLRQLVDEWSDWREDMASGLITLPMLLRMREEPEYLNVIRQVWSGQSISNDYVSPLTPTVEAELWRLVNDEASKAKALLAEAPNSAFLVALVDMKVAKATHISGSGRKIRNGSTIDSAAPSLSGAPSRQWT